MTSKTSTHQVNELGQPIGVALPDWQPVSLPPQTPMIGSFCRIAPLNIKADLDDLFDAFALDTEGANCTYLPYGPFKTMVEFQAWVNATCLKPDPMFHTIFDLQKNKAVGLAALMRIDLQVGSIEVGHVHYSPRLQRTPIATEAMYLFMSRVFDELGYRRFEWKCDSLNGPSNKAAVRYGFKFEGTFRQATIYRKRNRDTNWYSIIDSEWPAIKRAYQEWLSPNNFDVEGRQRSRLKTR